MNGALPELSFVIPARNESAHLRRQLPNIREHVPPHLRFEITVVDNGSDDDSVAVARTHGADAVLECAGTVGAVRNHGAAASHGSVLVFLDADVYLTGDWSANIASALAELRKYPRTITGSWVEIPDNPSWIERHWFEPLQKGSTTHINSGHLIVDHALFDELHGFDPSLATGEDFDFSRRAFAAGARIVDNSRLRVIHEGFPRTLRAFWRREYWHGLGDYTSLRTFLHSRVAIASQLFLWSIATGVFVALTSGRTLALLGGCAGAVGLAAAAAVAKFSDAPLRSLLVNTGLYAAYFSARGLGLFGRMVGLSGSPREQR